MDSLVLQTLIGLVFVFAAFAALVSIITEIIAHSIGLRGEYLLRGMRTLVDGGGRFELPWRDMVGQERKVAPAPDPDSKVSEVLDTPIIRRMAKQGVMPECAGNKALTNQERRAVPSYVSGRSFARAFLGFLVPDAHGKDYMSEVRDQLLTLPDGPRNALLPLVDQAE